MRRAAQVEREASQGTGLLFDPLVEFEKWEVKELWEKLAKRREPKKVSPIRGGNEAAMSDEKLDAVINGLEAVTDRLDEMLGHGGSRRGRRREREEEPESVRDMRGRGRRGEPTQVAFEVKVPVGREGGTLKGFLIFDELVRDDRDLEDLANEVERNFRRANVFTKDFNRGGGNGWNGGGGGYGNGYHRPYYDRDREWRR